MKEDKDFWIEKARNYLQPATPNLDLWVGFKIGTYQELGTFLHSLVNISQQSLFLEEEGLDNEIRIDIYNLLDMAKKIIPLTELEFLDEMRKEM